MKKFNVQIVCDSAEDLVCGLQHALNCVSEEPARYDEMGIDESDEMLDEPEVVLYRSE